MLSVFLKRVTFSLITLASIDATLGADVVNITQIPAPGAVEKLQVKVYYEALCPDSIRFVRYQLYDVMITKKLLKYADLKFIPYGKVTKWIDPETNKMSLVCQHGRRECELNALHACIKEHNTQYEQMLMIDCLMGKYTADKCAEMLEVNITDALECKKSRTIEDILKPYGEETDAIDIWFVPSIGIDGKFEPNIQDRILHIFSSVFCSKYKEKYNFLPPKCTE